jgi:hypothetical protein
MDYTVDTFSRSRTAEPLFYQIDAQEFRTLPDKSRQLMQVYSVMRRKDRPWITFAVTVDADGGVKFGLIISPKKKDLLA